MATTWGELYKAVEPVAREFWGLEQDEERGKRILEEIFDTESTEEPVIDVQEYGGPGTMGYKPEGMRIETDGIFQGAGKRFVAQTYAGGIEITQEAAEDAVKNLPSIKEAGRILGEMAYKTPEYLAAQFLDRAFNTSYPAFGDGTALCSASHLLPRGGTFANVFAGGANYSLSEQAIEQLFIQLTSLPGSSGMISPRSAKKLVVHPANAIVSWKLQNTQLQVGSANNDRSFVAGTLETVSNPFLGSTTRWFALTDANERGQGLNWKWRIKPEFRSDNELLLQYKLFVTRFRAMWFCKNPRAIFGSNAV